MFGHYSARVTENILIENDRIRLLKKKETKFDIVKTTKAQKWTFNYLDYLEIRLSLAKSLKTFEWREKRTTIRGWTELSESFTFECFSELRTHYIRRSVLNQHSTWSWHNCRVIYVGKIRKRKCTSFLKRFCYFMSLFSLWYIYLEIIIIYDLYNI